MAKRKTWFGLRYPNQDPIYFDELGSQFETSGLVLKGKNGKTVVLFLPGEKILTTTIQFPNDPNLNEITFKSLTQDEWLSTLKQLDNPEYYIEITKAIIGKNKRLIAADIQWEIFRRDNYTCHYCGSKDRPLTIDHKIPVESGGTDEKDNLLTACRCCNKDKGNIPYEDFIRQARFFE